MREAGAEWRSLVENRDLRFVQTVAEGNFPVLADRNALQRLINILLDNAVKYTPSPGAVELRIEQRGGKALINVCDTGIGIAPEDQSRIF